MIRIDEDQLERARTALGAIDNGFTRAVAASLNRAAMGFSTDTVRGTTSRYYVKASDVRKSFIVRRASVRDFEATIFSRGRRRPMAEYKVTPRTPGGTRRQLLGAVKKDGMKSLGRAFLMERRGQFTPYIRNARGDLEPFISPSIPQIVKNRETVAEAEAGASERFRKRLDHEILRLLGVFR